MSKKTTNKNTVGEGRNMRIKEHHLILTKRNIKHVNNWKTLVIIIWTCRTVFKLLWFYTVTSQTSNDPNSGCLELLHDFFLRMIPWNTDSWSYQWAKYGRLGFSGNKTRPYRVIALPKSLICGASISTFSNRFFPRRKSRTRIVEGSWNPPF